MVAGEECVVSQRAGAKICGRGKGNGGKREKFRIFAYQSLMLNVFSDENEEIIGKRVATIDGLR